MDPFAKIQNLLSTRLFCIGKVYTLYSLHNINNMTAKEKANELVNKFYQQRSKDNLPLTIYWTSAIGCALIAVDEILDQWEYYPHIPEEGLFWQEVKQEIEKL